MATKCKGLLCSLALLFLLTGFFFAISYSRSSVQGSATSPYRSTQSVFSAQPLTLPAVAASAPAQHEAMPAIQHSPDHLSTYHLIGTASDGTLFHPDIRKRLSTSALLLPVIARTLGLSTLVLRE